MTFPVGTTAHDELDLPAPDDYRADPAADRARAIAALHEVADWFTAHPDAPMPTSVVLHSHLFRSTGASLEKRLDTIDAFTVTHPDAHKMQNGNTVWAELPLIQRAGLKVDYRLMTTIQEGPL